MTLSCKGPAACSGLQLSFTEPIELYRSVEALERTGPYRRRFARVAANWHGVAQQLGAIDDFGESQCNNVSQFGLWCSHRFWWHWQQPLAFMG